MHSEKIAGSTLLARQTRSAILVHGDRGQRRFVRRLPQARIAANRRERRIPRPHRDREIERADDSHHAERMPLLDTYGAWTARCASSAIELPREPAGEVADVDHLLHFALALGGDLAHFERDESAKILLMFAQRVAELPDDPRRAAGRGSFASVRNASCARPAMRIIFGCRHLPHAGDARAVDRSDDVNGRPAAVPLAVESARVGIARKTELLQDIVHVDTIS
jgi:hypothetical protein